MFEAIQSDNSLIPNVFIAKLCLSQVVDAARARSTTFHATFDAAGKVILNTSEADNIQ